MTRPAVAVLAALTVAGTLGPTAGLSERGGSRHAATPGSGVSPRSLSSARIEGIGVRGWHARAVRNRRQINRMRHHYLELPSVVEAVNLACVVYGNCATLWRKARCETGGTFSARSFNSGSGASGLFQFLPSTWRGTPFGRFSVWSPYANALAAGWMHVHGRGGEWTCR